MLREAGRVVRIVGVLGWIASTGTGCASGPGYQPQSYVVQPRDTLYSIAWRHDLDYRDLARWNHIGSDYRIAVGQVLMLEPGADYPASRRTAHASPAPGSARGRAPVPNVSTPGTALPGGSTPGGSTSGGSTPGAALAGAPTPDGSTPGASLPGPATPGIERLGQPCRSWPVDTPSAERWMWPTAHAAAPRPVPGGGILLLGVLGQPIRAACTGRVVYAGSGIRGYGNLIIIKHGETVLSAYAHTVELRVHEGEEVATGQQIARMGTGPHDIAALYFEIRLNGKPVDPLGFLPAGAEK